jgi:hypothetical protein
VTPRRTTTTEGPSALAAPEAVLAEADEALVGLESAGCFFGCWKSD